MSMCTEHEAAYLSQQVGVEDLEHLVEAKLAQALHGVPDECGCPTLCKRPEALLLCRHSETMEHVLVLLRVDLQEHKWSCYHTSFHHFKPQCHTEILHVLTFSSLSYNGTITQRLIEYDYTDTWLQHSEFVPHCSNCYVHISSPVFCT